MKKNTNLDHQIMILANGNRDAIREYHKKKVRTTLILSLVLLVLCIVVSFLSGSRKLPGDGKLRRPDYNMPAREEELLYSVEGEKADGQIRVEVPTRKYTPDQESGLLKQAQEELETGFLGENSSADEVRSALYIPETLQGGAVAVSVLTMPYGILSEKGEIVGEPDEEGTLVELQITLSLGEREQIIEKTVAVYPPLKTAREQFTDTLRRALKKAGEEDPYGEYLTLPSENGGKKLTWKYPPSDSFAVWLLLLTVPLFYWFHSDRKIRDEAAYREQELLLDYPEMVWKMTMLLGAGLTIRSAFEKIALQYRKARQDNPRRKKHYLYEEMLWTLYQMKSGIPEAEAYELFGKRCALPVYIKLGSTLSQNLRKGSRGLAAHLEKEASIADEERRNTVRKMGERAGTKILLPMILMLGVVIAVLMVPAFMNI